MTADFYATGPHKPVSLNKAMSKTMSNAMSKPVKPGDFSAPARPPSFATTPQDRAAQLFNSAANHLDNALFVMRRRFLETRVRVPAGDYPLRAEVCTGFMADCLTEVGIAWDSLRHAEELGAR